MNRKIISKPIIFGFLGTVFLLVFYFAVVSLVSGLSFFLSQFYNSWYYVIALALGFGVQIGLYVYLRNAVRERNLSRKVMAVTGSTSAMAMISCCVHYLTNILPILGVTGFVTFLAQYQTQFFWLGLVFNAGGIAYIVGKIIKFKKMTLIKKQTKIAILAAVLFLTAFGAIYLVKNSGGAKEENKTEENKENVALEIKFSKEGDVEISVLPKISGNEVEFKITMDTHSVNLTYDIIELAELTDERGRTRKASGWDGDSSGGHHREGVLKFDLPSPAPKSFILKIRNVSGVKERVFKWGL